MVRSYVVDDAGSIVKMTIPAGEAGAGTYLPTWSGHGDAMGLWRQEPDGTLTLANSYTYDTWGRPTTTTHNGFGDLGFRFLYVGEFDVQWDDAFGLGLAYMHARHYSPTLGRFLQPDPDGSEANLYAYTANNPVTEMDPDGTCFIILCIAVGVVLFGGLGAGAGALRYSTGTEPWLDQSDSLGDAAVNGFVEAGSYAIGGPGLGAGVKILSKVPGVARVLRALRPVAPVVRRGGESAAAARGRAAHEALKVQVKAKGGGWSYEPRRFGGSGRELRPDVMTPRGRFLELKPNTPTGRAAGRRQAEMYRRELGLRGRVIYYNP